MKKLFTLLIMAILATATSFADISLGTEDLTLSSFSSFSGSGYQKNSNYKINDYSGFSVTDGMLSSSKLQLKASSGKLVSPTIKSSAGFDIEVTYTSATNMNLTVGGQSKSSGSVLTFSTTSTSTTFTLSVGSKYAVVDKIVLKPKKQSGKTLTSLAVSGTPTKTTYNEGDTFNPAGLTVTGTYSDGNPETITSGITWTFDPATLSAGQISVNVTAKVGDVTSPSYTVNGLTVNGMTALTTMDEIFTAATSAGATATDTKVTFNNWVVTGVKNSNAYVTDGTKGFIIYASGHGFEVGDVLSGTVNCKVQLFKGSSELTNLTSTTSGLTVTKGGTATPQTIDIADLSGVNTGAVLKFSNVTYNGTEFSDGTNTITPYNTFMTLPTLTSGVKYNVTGVFILFDGTKEIAPRTSEDIEEVQAVKYNVTIADGIANGTVSADPAEAPEGATVTLTATPTEGYKFDAWDVKDASNNTIEVSANQFTMPAANVTVSATFVAIPKFTVTIASGIANGAVSADVAEAPEGAEVTLTATPAEGYKFDAWDVKDASSNTIEVANNKFTMPAANVTVSATFVEKPATSTFVLVTNADQLAEGKKIVFVGKKGENFYSMGTKSDGNNRPGVLIEVENNEAYPSEDIQVFTLEAATNTADDATWMFNDGNDQYIYAAGGAGSSPKNHLKTASATTAGDNGKATISVNPDGVANVVFTGKSVSNIIKFNSTNNPPIFSCYSTGQTPVYIYMSEEAPATKTLDHITLSGTYQTEFNVGDTFNHEGMTVTASYAEEGVADADVTKQATFSTPDMTTTGEKTVTVSYTEGVVTKNAEYTITVSEKPKYVVTIEAPQNGTLEVKNGETVLTSGAEVYVGDKLTITATPSEGYKFRNLQVVDGSTHTYTASNVKEWTMGESAITVKANFDAIPQYTYTWYVNGQVLKTVNAYEGADIEAPNNPATPAALTGKVFTGWVTTSTVDASVEPTYVTVDTKATATTSYYAVFATAEQKGGGNDYYEEVTSSSIPVDWTVGDYLIVSDNGNNTAYVYNGSASENSPKNFASSLAAITHKEGKKVIETVPSGAAKITLSAWNSGHYIAQINGEDKYITSKDGNGNGLSVYKMEDIKDTENRAISCANLDPIINKETNETSYKLNSLFLRFDKPQNMDNSVGFRAFTSVQKEPVQFYVKKAGTHIEYSDWTTGEVPAAVTMTGTYRSKYIDNSEIQANSYKNTVTIAGINASQFAGKTFKVTRKENSSKRGDTGKPEPNEVKDVAQVTFSDDGSQYTLTYYNQEENENRRYDGDDVATTGTTANGVVVKDYFIFNTARGGDMARCYSYNVVSDDADVTAAFDGVPQFEAPVYSGHVVAYKMVSDSKVAYTKAEILAETSDNKLPPVYGAGVEFEPFENTYFEAPYSVASQKIKRNHSDASNSENVTVTEKDGYTYVYAKPNQSDAYSVEFEVQSKDGESNYYGTNQEIVYTGVVTAQIGNFDKSTYTFGDGGHYYYCTVKANMAETVEGMFSTVGGGVRVWRVSVTEPYEVIEQFANRGTNYRFFNSVPMESNAMEITGIGSDFTEYQESSFKNTKTGVFGSKSDAPHMNFLVRFYYKENSSNSAQSARRKIAAAEGEEYYVSDKYEELDFPSNIVTGVEDVFGAKEVKSVRYFNIMGVESAEPVDGVNIVVTTYTDGTSSSAKMLR